MVCNALRFAATAIVAGWAMACAAADLAVLTTAERARGHLVLDLEIRGAKSEPVESDLRLDIGRDSSIAPASLTRLERAVPEGWLLLCIDRSGSVGREWLQQVRRSMEQVLLNNAPSTQDGHIAMIAFGTEARQLLEFTKSTQQIAQAVNRLETEPAGKSRLFDALVGGLATLSAQGAGPKRLLIISDGKDEGSYLSNRRVLDLVQRHPSVAVDVIAIGPPSPEGSSAMATLAGNANGRFFRAQNGRDLEAHLRTVASSVRAGSAYSAHFRYKPAPDTAASLPAVVKLIQEGMVTGQRSLDVQVAGVDTSSIVTAKQSAEGASKGASNNWNFSVSLAFNWIKNNVTWPAALLAALFLALSSVLGRMVVIKRREERLAKEVSERSYQAVIIERTRVNPVERAQESEFKPETRGPAAPPEASAAGPGRRATQVAFAWPEPAPNAPVAELRGVSGALRGTSISISKALTYIGCDPGCDIVLEGDDFASGRHALVRAHSKGLFLEDLASTNGSFLNGSQFKAATRALSPGDEIRLGRTTFEVRPHQANLRSRAA